MKEKLNKLFGGTLMTWKRVIIFAIITGVYTGLIMYPDFLDETSFQDIGVTFEWWVLFAVIICVNCKKPLEAGLKCFVFFLISQPLVYVVEIPKLGHFAWEYYEYWLIWTFLTLPGGFIAWYAKKQNLLGALILAVACVFLGMHAGEFAVRAYGVFPHHLLSCLFCIAEIIVLTLCLQKKKGLRILILALSALAMAIGVFMLANKSTMSNYPLNEEHTYTAYCEDEHFTVAVNDGYDLDITARGICRSAVIILTDENGTEYELHVTVDGEGAIQYNADDIKKIG